MHKSRHIGIAFEGFQKIKKFHQEVEPDFLLGAEGFPEKSQTFWGRCLGWHARMTEKAIAILGMNVNYTLHFIHNIANYTLQCFEELF